MGADYVPDHLCARLFHPWTLPEAEWPLCVEDWARVNAITALPWQGDILDFGCGDGALSAMVASRHPGVRVTLFDTDDDQIEKALLRWKAWPLSYSAHWQNGRYDGVLCCEVLEHLTPEAGYQALSDIKAAMKPGAMLCVTVPHQARSRAAYAGHITPFTNDRLVEVVRAAGFVFFDDPWSLVGYMENDESVPLEMSLPWIWAVARA